MVSIDLYIHVITRHPHQSPSNATLVNQVTALNSAYLPYGFTFTHIATTYTNDWSMANSSISMHLNHTIPALRMGTMRTLNLFIPSGFGVGTGALGYCLSPFAFPDGLGGTIGGALASDGCLIAPQTLPAKHPSDPSGWQYGMGKTAVHEVGHWLGLLHVFMQAAPWGGECGSVGDLVGDTPPQSSPSWGCPVGKDTCAGVGVDSVHNYMDYSDDLW